MCITSVIFVTSSFISFKPVLWSDNDNHINRDKLQLILFFLGMDEARTPETP